MPNFDEMGEIKTTSKINKESDSFNITFNTTSDDTMKYEIIEIPKEVKRINTICKINELRKNKQIKTLYSFDHLPVNYKMNLKIKNENENDKSVINRKYNVIMKLVEGIELCYNGIVIDENSYYSLNNNNNNNRLYNRFFNHNGMLYFWSGIIISLVCVGIAINLFF